MTARFNQVSGVDALDPLFAQSHSEMVILYNHDPHCPISARAHEQMQRLDHDIQLVDVSRERAVTREIQERTGVRHESPQVILICDGQPTWSASHFKITADAVSQAVGITQAFGNDNGHTA